MTADRRTVLMAGLAASALATGAQARNHDLPGLDGELRFDGATRGDAAEDFGHLVHRAPRAVLLPASAKDVAAMIRWAGRNGLRFAARGRGHSVFGRAMARDGIVCDMSRLKAVHQVAERGIEVDAGATWREVLAATLSLGLTPPVLTDYLDLSIGGTLAVGGIGGTTSHHGMQCDNALALEVVTGTGRTIACSPTRHAQLFDSVRAGLGQVGVITRARLRLVPAPSQVHQFQLVYRNLPAMLADARLVARDGRFDAVRGAILARPAGEWIFRLEAVKHVSNHLPSDNALLGGLADDAARRQVSTLAYLDSLDRLAALEAALRANGQWFFPHPWLTTFLGDTVVEAVVANELARLTPADLGTFGQILLSPFRRQAVATPLLRLPADELCYAFNLVRIPTADSIAEARRLVAANRTTYARIRAAGGTLYPVSAFPLSRAAWRRHFGATFDRLREAKRKFDPGDVLTPGYAVF
jgi:FAD/FMN-containing dehydrogenase